MAIATQPGNYRTDAGPGRSGPQAGPPTASAAVAGPCSKQVAPVREAEARRGGRGCSGQRNSIWVAQDPGRERAHLPSLTRTPVYPFITSLTGQVGRERVPRYKTGLLYSSYLHKLRQTDGHSDTCLTCSSRECCQFDLSTSRGSWESGPSSQHVKTSLLHWPNRGSRQVPSTDE